MLGGPILSELMFTELLAEFCSLMSVASVMSDASESVPWLDSMESRRLRKR